MPNKRNFFDCVSFRSGLIFTLLLFFVSSAHAQPTYDQFITRLKGGGDVFFNGFTFKMEQGFARLDDEKITYIRKNVEKQQEDLVLYYSDVKSVKKLRYIIIFPWKFVIKMKDGTNHYFMLPHRKKFIHIIRSHIE